MQSVLRMGGHDTSLPNPNSLDWIMWQFAPSYMRMVPPGVGKTCEISLSRGCSRPMIEHSLTHSRCSKYYIRTPGRVYGTCVG